MSKRWLVAMSAMTQFACFCIARGAKVKTPRGEVKVEDVAVGDEVIVVDPETLAQHVGRVTHVRTAKRECGRLDQLRLTSSHPLYDPKKHEWAPAGDWLLGVRSVLQTTAGPTRVERAERFVGVDDVYDLTVDHPLHTFVADGVVVHNKRPLAPTACESAGVVEGESCECRHPDKPGVINCSGWQVTCACPNAVTFYSGWRTASGDTDAALADGASWMVQRCGGGASLVTAPDAALPAQSNALTISPGACGVLELEAGLAMATGNLWFRVSGPVTTPLALVSTEDVVLMGLAPHGSEVRLFTGTSSTRAEAVVGIEPDVWYRFRWELLQTNVGLRVAPRIEREGTLLIGTHLYAAPSQGGSLAEWYAAENSFDVNPRQLRFRLGSESPSEVTVQLAEVVFGRDDT